MAELNSSFNFASPFADEQPDGQLTGPTGNLQEGSTLYDMLVQSRPEAVNPETKRVTKKEVLDLIQKHVGGGGGIATRASGIPSAPYQWISSRTVQDALEEVVDDLGDVAQGGRLIGFQQLGTGALTRTVDAKLKDFISVLDFDGVDPTGATDSQLGLQACFDYAASVGRPVHAPAGTYRHSGSLTVNGFELFGDGPQTEFIATDTTSPNPQHNILLTGDGVAARNFRAASTWTGARQANTASQLISLVDATNFQVSGLQVQNSASAGILGQYCRFGSVFGNTIRDTLADGVHFTNDSSYVSIWGNKGYLLGDDAYAVVAYNLPRPAEYGGGNWPQSHDFLIFGNSTYGVFGPGNGGCCVSVVGARDVIATGNYAELTGAAGYRVISESSFTTYNASNVLLQGNVAKDCARSAAINHAQFFVYALGSGYTLDNIVLKDNVAIGSADRNALRIQNLSSGGPISNVTVDGQVLQSSGIVSLLNGTLDNVSITSTKARNLADGVFQVSGVSGDVSIVGGEYWNVFQTPSLNRFVNINTAAGITSLTINDHNVYGTNALSTIYAGDASATAARPVITAMRNTANRRALADVNGVILNGSNYNVPLSFTTNDIDHTLAYAGTQALEIVFSATRHQAIEVNFKIVRSNDSTQWQFLRQRWIYTNAAGVGTAGVDYVDTGGGFRVQRTDIDNFSNGTVGTWALSLSGGNVTATFTPTVASHIRFNVTAVYRSA